MLVDVFEPFSGVILLQHQLPLRVTKAGQRARNKIRKPSNFDDLASRPRYVVRHIRRCRNNLGKFADYVLAQSRQFRRYLRLYLGQAFNLGFQERLTWDVAERLHSGHALAEKQLAVPHADHLVDNGHCANPIQLLSTRVFGSGVQLRHDTNQPVFTQ